MSSHPSFRRDIFLLRRFRGHGQMKLYPLFIFYLYLSTSHEKTFFLEAWEPGNRGDATKRYVCLFRAYLSVLGRERHQNKIDSDISPSFDEEEERQSY